MEYPKKQSLYIIIFAALALSALGLRLWQYRWRDTRIELGGNTLSVLIARTPHQLYRGLGKRSSLGSHDGMMFLFPLSRRAGIVMREMQFPIDIVWLHQGVIVDIAAQVQTEPGVSESELRVYYPRVDANVVIELLAGRAEELGLKIGDRLIVSS